MVRFKNRWLLLELIPCATPTTTLSSKQIYNALRESVIENFGDAGWGAVGGSLTSTLKKAQLATIKHNREVVARMQANVAAHTSDAYDVYLSKSTKEIEALKD